MEWLTPMTALFAAAASIPLLLLLYFLKLKRQERTVSSTLLWKRAVQDLQVNAPFQKIRRNLLLLLQMLMLFAILIALAGPVMSLTAGPGRRYVLLIDRSASMSATDVGPTRLDDAKKQANVFVESIRTGSLFSIKGTGDQVMVIAFDKDARVKCNFTSDKRQLKAAIDSITPGDGASVMAEAIVVARAFAQAPGAETNNRSAKDPANLILFSDGRISDAGQLDISSDEVVFNCVGQSAENVAVTAMQARRSYENPEQLDVFAALTNFGDQAVTCDVQLSINGDVLAVKSVTVAGRINASDSQETQPGRVAVNFSLSYAQAGVLEVRHLNSDALPSDDAAWSVLAPPKKLSVLLVTKGNMVLDSALQAAAPAKFETVSPEQFDAMDHGLLSVQQSYDVIVLDGHVPAKYSTGRYLVFGTPPADTGVSVEGELENQTMVDWRPRHPVLQYVNMTNLFVAKCHKLVPPRDAEVIAELNESPAMVVVRRNNSFFLLTGFDVLDSNWPFEPGFVLFCYNALNFLSTQGGQSQSDNIEVGQPIIVEGLDPDVAVKIDGPGFTGVELMSNAGGTIRFPGTDRVGIYSLNIPERPARYFAANLLDAYESNIAPEKELSLSSEVVIAKQGRTSRSNLPVWPFLVIAALVLACLEWLVYNSKVRL